MTKIHIHQTGGGGGGGGGRGGVGGPRGTLGNFFLGNFRKPGGLSHSSPKTLSCQKNYFFGELQKVRQNSPKVPQKNYHAKKIIMLQVSTSKLRLYLIISSRNYIH